MNSALLREFGLAFSWASCLQTENQVLVAIGAVVLEVKDLGAVPCLRPSGYVARELDS